MNEQIHYNGINYMYYDKTVLLFFLSFYISFILFTIGTKPRTQHESNTSSKT